MINNLNNIFNEWLKIYRLLCYRFAHEYIEKLKIEEKFPIFKIYFLESKIDQTLEEYLSVGLVTSILLSFIFSYLLVAALYYLTNFSKIILILSYLLSIPFYFILFLILFLLYPLYRRNTLKKEIDRYLPDVALHLSTLSNAGIPYYKMFKIIGYIESYGSIAKIFKQISINTEIYNLDFIEAVKREADICPSKKLKELFYDIISTISSGGNLTDLLINKSNTLMKEKSRQEKNYAELLSMLAEMYVTIIIAGPLIGITMLSIIGLISNLPIRYDLLLSVLIYIGVPLLYIIFIIILTME